jgi:hypothetical protein
MSEETLSRFSVTFRSFDNATSQNYIVAHGMQEALAAVNKDPNCKEILSVSKVDEAGPKMRRGSGWVSKCLASPELNLQMTDELRRLHKGD